MFRETYKAQMTEIKPSEELLESVIQIAREQEEGKVQGKIRGGHKSDVAWRRPVVAMATIGLCISLAMPVLANSSDTFYELLYSVSPSMAQFFTPVKKSSESNGIKMEVQSAYIHENKAEIYITMQDLAGNRIDGTTDLYDSYSINRPFDSSAHCEFVGYDEGTKTAAFLIVVEEWGKKDISGEKMTFSVREFLSHKEKFEDIQIPIELSEVKIAESTQTVSLTGAGGASEDYIDFFSDEGAEALIQGQPMDEFPVKGIGLTGIGYIDSKLHIQTELKDRLNNDNHGYFYFKGKGDGVVKSIYNFYFTTEDQNGERVDYCEEVFELPQTELADHLLYGNFVTSNMKTEGNWRVTFSLENAEKGNNLGS